MRRFGPVPEEVIGMAKLGSVVFDEDLKWIIERADNYLQPSTIRTMGGHSVALAPVADSSNNRIRTYTFRWATKYQIEVLESYSRQGTRLEFMPGERSGLFQVFFQTEDPMKYDRHSKSDALTHSKGSTEELYGGELRVTSEAVLKQESRET